MSSVVFVAVVSGMSLRCVFVFGFPGVVVVRLFFVLFVLFDCLCLVLLVLSVPGKFSLLQNRRVTYGVVGDTKKTAYPNTLCSRSNSSAATGACRGSWRGPLHPENVSIGRGLYLKQGMHSRPLPCSL